MNNRIMCLFLLLPPFWVTTYPADHACSPLPADSVLRCIREKEEEGSSRFNTLILKHAPDDIRNLPARLNNPKRFLAMGLPCMLLNGPSGTTKSALVSAVAEEAHWEISEQSPLTLSCGVRNASVDRFRADMEKIERSGEKTIVFLDELDKLLAHTESEHYDSLALATALWTYIDTCARQKRTNIFFMATTNDDGALPLQLKQRAFSKKIPIKEITDPAFIREMFFTQLEDDDVVIDDDARAYLESSLDESLANPRLSNACAKTILTKAYDAEEFAPQITYDIARDGLALYRERYANANFKPSWEWNEERIKFGISTAISAGNLAVGAGAVAVSAYQAYKGQIQFERSHGVALASLAFSQRNAFQNFFQNLRNNGIQSEQLEISRAQLAYSSEQLEVSKTQARTSFWQGVVVGGGALITAGATVGAGLMYLANKAKESGVV